MTEIENRITIKSTIFDVFKHVADFEKWAEWQNDTLSVTVTSGEPVRAGTMVAMMRRFLGSKIFVNFDVLDFQRNKVIEMTGVHGRFAFRRKIEFASGGGETQIIDSMRLRVPWLWFWYRPFLSSALNRQLKNDWQQLDEYVAANKGFSSAPTSRPD